MEYHYLLIALLPLFIILVISLKYINNQIQIYRIAQLFELN